MPLGIPPELENKIRAANRYLPNTPLNVHRHDKNLELAHAYHSCFNGKTLGYIFKPSDNEEPFKRGEAHFEAVISYLLLKDEDSGAAVHDRCVYPQDIFWAVEEGLFRFEKTTISDHPVPVPAHDDIADIPLDLDHSDSSSYGSDSEGDVYFSEPDADEIAMAKFDRQVANYEDPEDGHARSV